jgi:hypothetical protein
MFRLFKVIREIRLYREYTRIIKKEKDESPFWKRKNLRLDNLNRIYTVINLPAQVLASSELPKEVRPSYVITEIKPINEYLKGLNLHELLTMWVEPIKDTNDESFLVVYQFLFRDITWLWVLRFLTEVIFICFVIAYRSQILDFFT